MSRCFMTRYYTPFLVFLVLLLVPKHADANVVSTYPFAHAAGVVSLKKIDHRGRSDSWKECYLEETYLRQRYGNALPCCEGIDPPYCFRASLARPNHVYCGLGFFLSYGVRHRDCFKAVHYYAPDGGIIRVVQDSHTTPRSCVWGERG